VSDNQRYSVTCSDHDKATGYGGEQVDSAVCPRFRDFDTASGHTRRKMTGLQTDEKTTSRLMLAVTGRYSLSLPISIVDKGP
jgi:hypothetical protein